MVSDIRRLGRDDAALYRQIRLDMLADVPEAFTASYAEAEKYPMDHWQKSLSSDRAYFGAFVENELVGSVNYLRETALQTKHRGWLLGMYVRPQFRGGTYARDLISHLLDHAKQEVIQVHLGVGATNARAVRLYQKLGFEIYGTEPRSLCIDKKYIDEHFMVLKFDKEE